jgi:hypothetical protein
MDVMRRGMSLLATLSPTGRQRVVAYWHDRLAQFPAAADAHGEQQLDIEDVLRSEPLASAGPRLTN